MRDPTLHIRLSDFITVMTDLGYKTPKKTAIDLFRACVPYNIQGRSLISPKTDAQRKRLEKALAAARTSSMTISRFNRLLDAERRNAGHRHLSPIRINTVGYEMLREVAAMACEFSNTVGITDVSSIDEGCKIYIQLGLKKMKRNYALGKFKFYDADIYTTYESYDMISTDPDKDGTREYHDAYLNMLAEYAGIERDVSSKPQDYVNFVYARLDSEQAGADAATWVQAQFEELKNSFDVVPMPNQLFGDNAIKRYFQYIGKPVKEDDIIRINTDKPMSDFERKYQEKLRNKNSE